MKVTKRKLKLSLIILLCTLMLSACTSDRQAESGKQEKVELRMTYWGDLLEKSSIENMLKAFNEKHPNIHVRAQQIQEDYITKMNTMAASNTLPDVGYFAEGSLPPWVENNKLMDLTSLFKSGEIHEKLDYAIYQFGDGPIVGASVANEVLNIYYNKDIFDEANVPYPPDKAEEAWTWEQFVEVAKKLTTDRNGKHPDEEGFDPTNIRTYGVNGLTAQYEAFLYSNGGGVVSLNGKDIILDESESIEALQKIADLMYIHHVMPRPADLSTIPTTDTALLTKRVAMNVDGQWAMQTLGKAIKDQGLNLGIGVLPKFKKPVTTSFGTPIVIFNTEHTQKHRDEVEEFVKYIMDPSNTKTFA